MKQVSQLPTSVRRTFSIFWEKCAYCNERVRLFLVPARDSVAGDWGNKAQAAAGNQTLSQLGGHKLLARHGITELQAFEADQTHMTKHTSKIVHADYWDQIDRLCVDATDDPLCVRVWDYFVRTAHMKKHWQTHVQFWMNLMTWGEGSPEMRIDPIEPVTRAIGSGVPESGREAGRASRCFGRDGKCVASKQHAWRRNCCARHHRLRWRGCQDCCRGRLA